VDGESIGCIVALLVVGLLAAAFIRILGVDARRRREEAEAYRSSLTEAETHYRRTLELLRANPHDPDMREKALGWGRRYAGLTRQPVGSSVTIYDEVAVANDINAACAAATRPAQPQGAPSTSLEERLERLQGLLNRGVITAAEFNEKRAQLLNEL
jgi:type II secretory pathway pseudopilin PulG